MHQELFAARIGVPVATVRSIEAGRRPMTPENCLNHILFSLGAAWNPREENWHVLNPHSRWLYEKKHEQLVPQLDPEDPYLDDLNLHQLINRLLDVFGATDRQQRRGLLLYLNDHLAAIAEASELKVNLGVTEPEWLESTKLNVWGKLSDKPVVWRAHYPKAAPIPPRQETGGIFDFRSRRTFKPADYPATAEEMDAWLQASKRERKSCKEKQ
jgi:hypothetical protein